MRHRAAPVAADHHLPGEEEPGREVLRAREGGRPGQGIGVPGGGVQRVHQGGVSALILNAIRL